MSHVLEMNVVDMFLQYQVKVAWSIILITAILIPFYYSYMDKRDIYKKREHLEIQKKLEDPEVPRFYIILPLIPLIIIFADYFIDSTNIDVISANIMGFTISFIVEFLTRKDKKNIPNDIVIVLKAMGNIFVTVVSIIISASVFAEGIKILGGISIFTNMISDFQGATIVIMVLLTGITYIFAIIMGSGAAPFFAFGPLTPAIATKLGVPTITLLLPMELATSIGRASSPVCGALIAIAGVAEVTPMELAKRTAPLLFIMLIINMIASYIFTI